MNKKSRISSCLCGFPNPRLERLFLVKNVKNSYKQTITALLLGMFTFMVFTVLDYYMITKNFYITCIVRLVVVPSIYLVCLLLLLKIKSKIEIWAFVILMSTQVAHYFLAFATGFTPEYLALTSSIVVVFPLSFPTLRFNKALVFLIIDLIVFFLVLGVVLQANLTSILFASFFICTFSIVSLMGGYSREHYIRKNFLQAKELDYEKKRSEDLLLNILPVHVAESLKNHDKAPALGYEGVTVLFTDFSSFTKKTEGVDAKEIISTLDRYFSYFDIITKKYKLEKIKTIGDSYMLAGGLDNKVPTHPIDCILAAFDFLDFMETDKRENPEALHFNMRIGVHTGPVVAGIIGSLKFTYDIFGATVNIASRMEKFSESNKINVSRTTYELVKDFFEAEQRSAAEVKQGETYEMFYLNGIKKDLCLDFGDNMPNAKFVEMYNSYNL